MVELILQTILRISTLSFLFSKPHDKMLLGSFRGLWHLLNSGSSRTSAGLDEVGIKSRYCLTTFITTYEQKLDTRIRDRKGEGGRFEGSDVDDVDGGVSSMLCPRSASRRSWMIIAVVAVILLTMSLRHVLTHESLFVLSPCLETHFFLLADSKKLENLENHQNLLTNWGLKIQITTLLSDEKTPRI